MWAERRNTLMNIGRVISDFPLFSYEAQWIYLLGAFIAPWVLEDWEFLNFLLFFYMAALSLIPATLRKIVERRRRKPMPLIDYSRAKPKWFALFLLKDNACPKVMQSLVGMYVFYSFLGGFSLDFMLWGTPVFILISIFMIWYLWQDNFSG